jgi:hypothetical protein
MFDPAALYTRVGTAVSTFASQSRAGLSDNAVQAHLRLFQLASRRQLLNSRQASALRLASVPVDLEMSVQQHITHFNLARLTRLQATARVVQVVQCEIIHCQ